jgi:hypothetical protein
MDSAIALLENAVASGLLYKRGFIAESLLLAGLALMAVLVRPFSSASGALVVPLAVATTLLASSPP